MIHHRFADQSYLHCVSRMHLTTITTLDIYLTPVVQRVDNAIRWIYHYPVMSGGKQPALSSLLGSDLSGGKPCPNSEQLGPVL